MFINLYRPERKERERERERERETLRRGKEKEVAEKREHVFVPNRLLIRRIR